MYILFWNLQISKQLLSTKENPSPIKFVFFEEGKEYQKLKELILAIHKNNKNSHILILGRTNKIIDTMYEEPELIDDMETKVKYQGYGYILFLLLIIILYISFIKGLRLSASLFTNRYTLFLVLVKAT